MIFSTPGFSSKLSVPSFGKIISFPCVIFVVFFAIFGREENRRFPTAAALEHDVSEPVDIRADMETNFVACVEGCFVSCVSHLTIVVQLNPVLNACVQIARGMIELLEK